MARTLISFLGTGKYEETTYSWPDLGKHTTKYAPAAIASLWEADRIVVFCTSDAKKEHGEGLAESLRNAGLRDPEYRELPSGRSDQELWRQFEVIRNEVVSSRQDEVLLDITHGFRSQPFFAGAVISVLQASGHRPQHIGVVYGEFRKDEPVSLIWDMSLFVELMDWAQALGVFLKTGRAQDVVELGRKQQKVEAIRAKTWGDRELPQFGNLISAIDHFSRDLATVRAAHIITGYQQDDGQKQRARGSALKLLDAIEQLQSEALERIPPLGLILDRLAASVRPLIAERLWSEQGQSALLNLARYYLDLGRYPEAATVVREARVNLYSDDERGVEVNSPSFNDQQRGVADQRFSRLDPDSPEVGDVRNDLDHAGFRRQPHSGDRLADRMRDLVQKHTEDQNLGACSSQSKAHGRTYFVSRHPGAAQWAREQGIEVDHWLSHIDVDKIQRGDTVIGSLPVHLAAKVCSRGGRYMHLSLDLPEEWRGEELSAKELRACNARLCEYYVFSARD